MGTTVSEEGHALPGAESTRVLVVDDHRMFTELLAHLLDGYDDIELVGVATTADEALAFAATDTPDVAVIDYRLPGEDGARVAARFKAAHPSVKLVMLTGFDDDEVLRSAITAGCSGFVTKDRAAEDLVERGPGRPLGRAGARPRGGQPPDRRSGAGTARRVCGR